MAETKKTHQAESAQAAIARTILGYVQGGDPDVQLPKILRAVDVLMPDDYLVEQRALIPPGNRRSRQQLDDVTKKPVDRYRSRRAREGDRELPRQRKPHRPAPPGRRSGRARLQHPLGDPAWTPPPPATCTAPAAGRRSTATSSTSAYEELDGIIRQGKELGVYFYIYSGGEPLVRKDDIIAPVRASTTTASSCAFTNATLIDEAFAEEMLRREELRPRHLRGGLRGGHGRPPRRRHVPTASCDAMAHPASEHKLPFGVSCCYTRANAETIGSEAYFDEMIEWGAKFAWFFHLHARGQRTPRPTCCPPPEQREAHVPPACAPSATPSRIFTMDFQNDGEYVGRLHRRRAALPAHQRQRRRGALRVHPLLRLQHPGRRPCWRPCSRPLFMAYHDGPALQRQPPAPLPRARQQRPPGPDGGCLGRALYRPGRAGGRGSALRQDARYGRPLGAP